MKVIFAQTNYPGFLKVFYDTNQDWEKLTYNSLMKRWSSELFGTANFYSKNIAKYGVQAKEIIMNDWNSQSIWARENNLDVSQNSILFSDRIPELIKNTLGLREWVKKITFAQVERFKPDIL